MMPFCACDFLRQRMPEVSVEVDVLLTPLRLGSLDRLHRYHFHVLVPFLPRRSLGFLFREQCTEGADVRDEFLDFSFILLADMEYHAKLLSPRSCRLRGGR